MLGCFFPTKTIIHVRLLLNCEAKTVFIGYCEAKRTGRSTHLNIPNQHNVEEKKVKGSDSFVDLWTKLGAEFGDNVAISQKVSTT